jgi:NADPH:quinone reductase-like Zn-dependent oxidoreductase
MSGTMKAIATHARGSVADLRITEVPVPEPGPEEVRVRVVASAVNPADHKVATGTGGAGFIHAKVFPQIAGYDLSGTIDALGAAVDGLAIGDAVFGHLPYASSTKNGTFAELVTISAATVAKKPAAISHETAAALATSGLTALQALRDQARIGKDHRVLVVGASGGLGSLAIGVAKRLGASVTGICSADAAAFVRELGADEVIERGGADPWAGGPRFDAVLDTPNAFGFFAARRGLRAGGTYLPTLPSPAMVLGRIASLLTPQRMRFVVVVSRRADLETLATWVEAGMRVPIETTYPVREAAAALEAIVRGGRRGRLAITVAGGW